MLNSSPVRILKSFSQEELKDFKEFISSPYFNKNQNVINLYQYLRKYYPDFNSDDLEKETVYRKLFKKEEYNDGFMRTLIFNLSNLLEDYLAYINYSKNGVVKGINLLKELNERKIEKVFLKNFMTIEKINESSLYKDPDYFINKYNLTTQREWHNLWNKNESSPELNEKFQNAYQHLTFFYLCSILKEYRYLIYLRGFSHREDNYEFLEHLLDFLSENKNLYIENPYINLHLNEILLQTEKSSDYFYKLKDILKSKADVISGPDRFSLQNILQIFCITKIFGRRRKLSK